jgi:hypothetical protein
MAIDFAADSRPFFRDSPDVDFMQAYGLDLSYDDEVKSSGGQDIRTQLRQYLLSAIITGSRLKAPSMIGLRRRRRFLILFIPRTRQNRQPRILREMLVNS